MAGVEPSCARMGSVAEGDSRAGCKVFDPAVTFIGCRITRALQKNKETCKPFHRFPAFHRHGVVDEWFLGILPPAIVKQSFSPSPWIWRRLHRTVPPSPFFYYYYFTKAEIPKEDRFMVTNEKPLEKYEPLSSSTSLHPALRRNEHRLLL